MKINSKNAIAFKTGINDGATHHLLDMCEPERQFSKTAFTKRSDETAYMVGYSISNRDINIAKSFSPIGAAFKKGLFTTDGWELVESVSGCFQIHIN